MSVEATKAAVPALHQAGLIERVTALLALRRAERDGGDTETAARRVVDATEAIERLEREHRLPFATALRMFGSSARARDALVLIAAPHLDASFRDAISAYWGRATRRHVDAALLLEVLTRDRQDAIAAISSFTEDGPFHQSGLVESIGGPAGAAAIEQELVPTPRLLRLLAAETGLDPRLRRFASLLPARPEPAIGVLAPERLAEIVGLTRAAGSVRRGADLLLSGPRGCGKLRVAMALASELERRALVVVESAFLPSDPQRLIRVLEALALDAQMLGAALVLRRVEHLVDSRKTATVLQRSLASLDVDVWLTADVDPRHDGSAHLDELATLLVAVPPADTALRRIAWASELARAEIEATDDEVRLLAAEYPLPRASIEVVARLATHAGETRGAALARVAESQMRGQLARFAKRSRNRSRLEHLVLSEATREQVLEVLEAARRRTAVMDRWGLAERHATGRGLVAMFNGAPGTGKTLSANVIANELELPLYRIDVSNIVDRYVGETEKNLNRLFEEAAACRAALLFDEADSLFGKRVDASDANDRFANMQVNTLLNLIEDYDGFVVLTTNLKSAIDSAFLRRIAYKVVFDMPEVEERLALWAYHLPASIPRADDVDLQALAEEFDNVAGGDIKNAVLRAALATGGDAPVTQMLLRQSMVNEMRANGSVVRDRK